MWWWWSVPSWLFFERKEFEYEYDMNTYEPKRETDGR